jgi:hypothetical protein
MFVGDTKPSYGKIPMKLRFAWKPLLVQSLIVGLAVFIQYWLNAWTSQRVRVGTLDGMAIHFLLFASVNFAVFYVGDRIARRRGWSRRTVYMAIGAAASSCAHVVGLAPAAYVAAAADGIILLLVAIPLLVGAATAFLLHLSLGYSAEGDDPHALAASVSGETVQSGGAFHDIGSAQYYDGPLQIRTSSMAGLWAALAGSSLYSVTVMFSFSDNLLPAGAMPPLYRNNPMLAVIGAACVYTPLFYLFVMKSHSFLQARQKDSMKSYVLAGLFVPLGFALAFTALMGPFGILMVLPWILPSCVAMIAYYRLAGFEPLALPGDIEVSDPRALLPADHVRRRARRIVPNS